MKDDFFNPFTAGKKRAVNRLKRRGYGEQRSRIIQFLSTGKGGKRVVIKNVDKTKED